MNGWLVNPWGAGTDDTHKAIPFVMSTGGYGIFVNTTFRNRWDIGSRSVVSYTFLIDDPRLDFFILYGPSLKASAGALRRGHRLAGISRPRRPSASGSLRDRQ